MGFGNFCRVSLGSDKEQSDFVRSTPCCLVIDCIVRNGGFHSHLSTNVASGFWLIRETCDGLALTIKLRCYIYAPNQLCCNIRLIWTRCTSSMREASVHKRNNTARSLM